MMRRAARSDPSRCGVAQRHRWIGGGVGLVAVVLAGCGAAETRLSGPGRPILPVVVSPHADQGVRGCAQELSHWLHQVCGRAPEIVTYGPDVRRGIFVGLPDDFPEHVSRDRLLGLGPETFWLHTEGQRVMLIGNTPLAVSHAVYAFLEELGCRWYFPDPVWTVVPRLTELRIRLDRIERPHYRWRRIWYGWGVRSATLREDFLTWQRRNRLPGAFDVVCEPVYERFLPRSQFRTHANRFAVIDGQHDPRQICVTRGDVIRLAVAHARQQRVRHPRRAVSLACGPNDLFCSCPNCRSIGAPGEQPFWFANHVAARLALHWPDTYVTLYAYHRHADPPKFAMHSHVHVQVVNGFRHSRQPFDRAVAQWSRVAPSFGIYDYWSVWPWDRDLPGRAPAGRLDDLARRFPTWFDQGASTLDAEASCNWGPNGLGYYVGAKLMWNTRADAGALADDFYQRAFGRAAAPVQRYYQRWQRGQRLTEQTLALAYRDLHQADALDPAPAVRRRLSRLKMYLHFLHLNLQYDRAAQRRDRAGIIRYGEGLIRFARRITDTGLVYVRPMLYSAWFGRRFRDLVRVRPDCRSLRSEPLPPDPIPSDAEIDGLFAAQYGHYESLHVVDVHTTPSSRRLIRPTPKP